MKTNDKVREVNSGQYKFDGGFERPCQCGHTLGNHVGERYRNADGTKQQECIVHETTGGEPCDCQCFKPARKKVVK